MTVEDAPNIVGHLPWLPTEEMIIKSIISTLILNHWYSVRQVVMVTANEPEPAA